MNRPARSARFPASLGRRASTGTASERPLLRPQRPLHDAARGAPVPTTGVGLESNAVRANMVAALRAAGIGSEPVLTAFATVERHAFVDTALIAQAYEDTSLPIGHGQTISKPSVVARMLEWLHLGQRARSLGHLGNVLEIGTGCGYQTALLALLARGVVSIERIGPLHAAAQRNLEPWRGHRVRLVHGDGMGGHAPNHPYDSIIAAAGGDALPQAWLDQLAIGGRLVAPAHDAQRGGQVLVIVDRTEDGWQRTVGEGVRFVPLRSGLV